MSNFI